MLNDNLLSYVDRFFKLYDYINLYFSSNTI